MFKKRSKKAGRLTREEIQARRLLEKELLAQERSNNRAWISSRVKKNPHRRYGDIAHLEIFEHRDNIVTVQEKYGCKLEKFR